jgi:hypothetical protein
VSRQCPGLVAVTLTEKSPGVPTQVPRRRAVVTWLSEGKQRLRSAHFHRKPDKGLNPYSTPQPAGQRQLSGLILPSHCLAKPPLCPPLPGIRALKSALLTPLKNLRETHPLPKDRRGQ